MLSGINLLHRNHFWTSVLLVFFVVLTSSVYADVVLEKQGFQVDAFPNGFSSSAYDRKADGTLELGPWDYESTVVYRFYLPPACGNNYIDSLTITIEGQGEIDEVWIGTSQACGWLDLENTVSFSWPNNPDHPTMSINDMLATDGSDVQARYIEVLVEINKTWSNYELNNIKLQFSYSGVSDTIVNYFLDSYGAYLDIKNATPFIHDMWATSKLSELAFWLGVNHSLIGAVTSTYQTCIGELIGLGLGEIT